MVPEFKTAQVIVPTSAITAASTNFGSVDTKGYSYLVLDVVEMSASAATQLTALSLGETDTAPTAWADCTVITAFVGGTVVDSTHGFVLPTPSSTTSNIYRFNVDLRGRKRYIGLEFEPAVSTRAAVQALLFRSDIDPAMAAVATGTAGCRLIVSG